MKYVDVKRAPGPQVGRPAPTRLTTDSQEPADHQFTPIPHAQMAAWDRLWNRLLRPVDTRREKDGVAA